MKAILEYELPEDIDEFILASRAQDWALAIYDMDQQLRSWLKYGYTSSPGFESVDETLETVRNTLHDLLAKHNLNLDMLY